MSYNNTETDRRQARADAAAIVFGALLADPRTKPEDLPAGAVFANRLADYILTGEWK